MRTPTSQAALVRSCALGGLIVAEGLALGLAYDAESLSQLPRGWWQAVFALAPRIMPIAASVAAAGLLVVGPRIREQLRTYAVAAKPSRVWPLLLGQLAAFAALFILTGALFEPIRAVVRSPGPWVVTWLLAAAATGALWLAALLPLAVWRVLLREATGLLVASIGIGLLAYAAGHGTQGWWKPLHRATFAATAWILHLVEPSACADAPGFLIGAHGFVVHIGADCSGYEGIGLVWVFLGACFWIFRQQFRFPNVLLLLPIATAAVYAANILRIAALVLIGAHGAAEIAVGGFHSYAGIILFSGIALTAVTTARRLPFFAAGAADAGAFAPNPAAPFLVPFLVMIAANLLVGLFSTSTSAASYPLGLAAAAAALWHYRAYRRLGWSRPPLAALATGAVVFLVWIGILSWLGPAADSPPSPWASAPIGQPWRALWFVCRIAGYVAAAPIVEELAFRGYLARRLMAADFLSVTLRELSWPAILISSAFFAAVHPREHWAVAFAAGLGYAWAATRRGRLADAVLAHVATNALLLLFALCTGYCWALG